MKTPLFAATFLALCLPAMAQSSPEPAQGKAQAKKTPQERENLLGVTPEARQAKLLEREQYIEKRRGELEKKKVAGTLTPKEAKVLQQMETRRKFIEQVKPAPSK